MHEHIHAHSVSYYDETYYRIYRIQEEAAVELLAQEISIREGYPIAESATYGKYVDELRAKSRQCKQFDNDLEFAQALIQIEPRGRDRWVERMIENSKTLQ